MASSSALVSAKVEVYGDRIVKAKLLAAAPRILAENRRMVTEMLDYVKPVVIENTPLGPGHFGYHLRDTYTTDVKSEDFVTRGVLKSAVQGYWRERGTKRGERAFRTAHKALAAVRRFIHFYYGNAQWWRL